MTESQQFQEAIKQLLEARFSSIPNEERTIASLIFMEGVAVGMEVAHNPEADLSDLVRARI